ncbi:MAG TPA: FGGY-family carbohydrate kinase, partial [Acetobacteraceae bacterium]|nr:FGGY-family carbohydrate kinase [Acetobacteraceae bacterium]
IFGLTRGAGRAELCRAALESVAFQTRDLLDAMRADWTGIPPPRPSPATAGEGEEERSLAPSTAVAGEGWGGGSSSNLVLRVDGGMVASDWTMQFLADLLGAPVDRPTVLETTALGAAYLAGVQAGLCPAPDAAGGSHWRLERRFLPAMMRAEADARYAGWQDAVRRTLSGAGA